MMKGEDSYKLLSSKWMLGILLFAFFVPVFAGLSLTKEELQWIKDNPIVKFTGDPNWLPYEAFDENGNYIGIVAEHLKIISEETGLIFKMSPSNSWTESVNNAKSKEVDVLSEIDDSDLKSHLDFTDPYISNPIIIVMRNDENYVENIELIKNKKIALIKDYGYDSKIRKKSPKNNNVYHDIFPLDNKYVVDGAGIGLVITKHLMAMMKGDVGVESLKGKGSVFWIELEGIKY